ncbi:unnamed protein product [Gongylonema pulchrum]|uniref:Uncharacterized protein n=1 Tax=Gongylonema pulchrum TaxID=637853 RepID=A0A3P7NRD7_9BILA|nr:unnamed protein product [Gongylonema pulchrum]
MEAATAVTDSDVEAHGGWRHLADETDLRGGINIAIESNSTPSTYLAAMDNGHFTIGAPHLAAEGPSPNEVCL